MSLDPWKVLSSRRVLDEPWLRARADSCEMADGTRVDPYYVLEYADWVHVVGFDGAGRILVIHQYRHALGQICTEIPAGSMDPEDGSPLEAARRELLEETGHRAARFEYLGAYSPNPGTHDNRVHNFVGYDLTKVAEPKLDRTERIEHEFMEVERVMDLIDRGEFQHFLHVSAVFLALKHTGRLAIRQRPRTPGPDERAG